MYIKQSYTCIEYNNNNYFNDLLSIIISKRSVGIKIYNIMMVYIIQTFFHKVTWEYNTSTHLNLYIKLYLYMYEGEYSNNNYTKELGIIFFCIYMMMNIIHNYNYKVTGEYNT